MPDVVVVTNDDESETITEKAVEEIVEDAVEAVEDAVEAIEETVEEVIEVVEEIAETVAAATVLTVEAMDALLDVKLAPIYDRLNGVAMTTAVIAEAEAEELAEETETEAPVVEETPEEPVEDEKPMSKRGHFHKRWFGDN